MRPPNLHLRAIKKFDKILVGLFLSSLILIMLPYDIVAYGDTEHSYRFLLFFSLSGIGFILLIRFWNKELNHKLVYKKLLRVIGSFVLSSLLLFSFLYLIITSMIQVDGICLYYQNTESEHEVVIWKFYRFPTVRGEWKVHRIKSFPHLKLNIEKDFEKEDMNGVWKVYGNPTQCDEYQKTVRFLNGEVVEILDSVKVEIKE